MELRILCKHLVADKLNGKFTVGEDSADIVGITLPRFYEKHDLSNFSFRITAMGKCKNSAVQILEKDNFDEKSVHLLWIVTSDFTFIPEEFTLILTGVNADNSVTIKFKSCPISVNPDKSWEFMPSPELSEQLLNQTHNEVQKAIDAANRAEKASQTPAPAKIYPATEERLGGIKSGGDISVSNDGIVTVISSETLKNEITDVKSSQKSIFNLALQIAHPNNFLIYDDVGKPSVMVAIPKFYLDEVINGASHTVHPAFIINGVEQDVIYISKYQNIVENGRAYSLPMKDPAVNLDFDQACNYCKDKGNGWHLMTNAEWAAIALWCKKNGTMPKGNNNYGKDISETDLPQKAISAVRDSNGKINRIFTGSGPANWYHDGTFAGIADLNGNIGEWNSGLRLNNSEINIIVDNNAAANVTDISSTSTEWKAIMPDGTLVEPNTIGTLKYKAGTIATDAGAKGSFTFESIKAANGLTIPDLMKVLALAPDGTGYDSDNVWITAEGERMLSHGGDWGYGKQCGVFALYFNNLRSYRGAFIGFRSCYYNPV